MSWWSGDSDGSDLAGNNHGELLTPSRVSSGLVDNALKLEHSAVALSAQPPLAGGFTIEGWVSFDSRSIDAWLTVFNNNQLFIRKNNPAEGGGFAAFIKLADGTVEPRTQSGVPATAETWTHIATTWDGETFALYIDGRLAESTTRSGALVADAVGPRIGSGEQLEVEGQAFSGLIDELTIYDRALDATDIAAIHAAGSAGKCKPA